MRFPTLCALALVTAPLAGQQAGPWDLVARTFARATPATGDVYRVTFPRSDLAVKVGDVTLQPALALTSWAAFAGATDAADVMGDLVLTEAELPIVTASLLDAGFEVTAIHHHLLGEAPRIYYLHYHGRGPAADLAGTLRTTLSRTGTPLGPPGPAAATAATLDTAALFAALGEHGRVTGDVASVGVATSGSHPTMDGRLVPLAQGLATAINIQSVTPARAVATGDFVVTGARLRPLLRALTMSGIRVTAVHNHLVGEEPRAFFIHFWADGAPLAVARGLKVAIDSAK
ncbi:MAG TPA: DUF1259 domain-containing protein [Gemmatimonadales bacterium]|nr:DUF1259 domain-containing protein [Gemmatimonadales bacterium]